MKAKAKKKPAPRMAAIDIERHVASVLLRLANRISLSVREPDTRRLGQAAAVPAIIAEMKDLREQIETLSRAVMRLDRRGTLRLARRATSHAVTRGKK